MYRHKLSEIVKQQANFSFIGDGKAYYTVTVDNTIYEFPIPISDLGTGTLGKTEKGILLMRWIRKAIDAEEMRMSGI